MIKAFTAEDAPLKSDVRHEIPAMRQLIEAARERAVPVIFTTTVYDAGLEEAGLWKQKVPHVLRWLVKGSDWVAVDERLDRKPGEALLEKKYSSCFFGTDLMSRLVSRGIDTMMITGIRTSTCIRATAVDACSYGLHAIVVQEAVADTAELPHLASLIDIDARYGDVVDLGEALAYLAREPRMPFAEPD